MKRMAEEDLEKWFKKKNRMPLILRGARQVGKSTLVRMFCKEHDLDLIEVNLERDILRSLGAEKPRLSEVVDEIQLLKNKNITKHSVLFLDEIQEEPKLLALLRYFYEERPDLAVIAAGSLLEIALRAENFSFPVGRVEFYHLGPMTFREFLLAIDQKLLLENLDNLNFSPAMDALAKEHLKKFLYIGGMPKAIATYIEEGSLVSVREIQEQILQTYVADFPKYNSRINVERVQKVFYAASVQAGKKVIYQRFDSESQSREIRKVIELLLEARVLLACHHTDANSVPLAGEMDLSIYKLYFLDVGLLNCLLRLDLNVIDEEMRNDFNSKGVMMEQFVAQHLNQIEGNSVRPALYYWLRDKGIQKGEIDFIIQKGQKVVPVEVKSVGAGHMKSAFFFAKEKKSSQLIRVSTLPFRKDIVGHKIGDTLVELEKVDLPAYAVELILRVV